MKKQGNLEADAIMYRDVGQRIEQKFAFLFENYRFLINRKQVIYGIFISYIRDEFILQFSYGAPEFYIETSIEFSSRKRCYLGKLSEFSFIQWDKEWQVPPCKDKVDRGMIFPYEFLQINLNIMLEKSKIMSQMLSEQDYTQG